MVSFTVSNPDSVSFTASAESSDATVSGVDDIIEEGGNYVFNVAGFEAGTATITIKLTGTDNTVLDTHTISVSVEGGQQEDPNLQTNSTKRTKSKK